MNTKKLITAILGSLILSGSLSITPPFISKVQAEEAAAATKSRVRRTPALRPVVYQRLDEVRQLADEKQYSSALDKLRALEKMPRNSYERAMTSNMYAYVHFSQERYAEAAEYYRQVLGIDNIPESLELTTRYSLAKLYLLQEQYQQAVDMLNSWFAMMEKPGAEAYILRAQMYYQLEQYKNALPDVKKAIALNQQQGNTPRENWLLLERAVYYQNKDFAAMERCLKDLISYYPKAQYWVQLSAVYNEMGKPEKELSALETAYEQQLLSQESQIISLAQAMLMKDIPYKAAEVLLQGIKAGTVKESARNLSLLADALMLAREYDQALNVMEKAAGTSGAAADYYKLAQIYTERQQWQKALDNITQALNKGGLNDEHQAYILQGLVLFNMERFGKAREAFKQASRYPQAEKMAQQWLNYIDNEEKRRAYMKAG